MEQDFNYDEEDFNLDEENSADKKPLTIDEIIDKEGKEEKITFSKLLSSKKLIIIIVSVIFIVIIIIIIAISLRDSSNKQEIIDSKEAPEEIQGEIQFDKNGFIITDDIVPEDNIFKYSVDEITRLREAGYTSTEIEEFEKMEVTNIDSLVSDIELQKRKSILDHYHVFLRNAQESGNEQYLYALANTWLGLAPQEVNASGEVDDYYKDSCNADYWKLPLQGYQPILKVKFVDKQDVERTVYMPVEPTTYVQLRESGNIVISYNFIKAYGCEFITNIQEVK